MTTPFTTTAEPLPPEEVYREYTDYNTGIVYGITSEVLTDPSVIDEYIDNTYVWGEQNGSSVYTIAYVYSIRGRPRDLYIALFFCDYSDWKLYVYKRK